ncbi:MAG: hypothetical protein KDE59_18420, partial [Anaerolineales bacterium]|nr:hypothetical protein [Anaerolineales bacterium]
QPAGGPDPDDVVHSPTVAYDHFNEGWIVAWLGQTGNAATLYYTSYNGADSQARLVRQAVPLSGILPPAGLTAACQPQPTVTNLTDCRVGGHETAANPGSGALFWQEVVLEYDSPFYGAYNNETTLPLIIDADAPDSHFVNLPAYVRPDELIIIGGEATDPTSSVARVEISVNGGPFEPATEGASAASWVYALATGPAGILNLAIRAVDAAENIQVGLTTATIIVDGSPPEVNISLNNGAIVAPVEEADGAWILPLSGTVTDPTVSGQPGSGVASLAISLSPAGSLGGAWVPLTWAGAGAWQVDYPLADAATNRTPYDLTGSYDLRVRATDQLGQTREALLATIGLDNRPPQATLDLIAGTEVTVTTLVTAHPLLAGTFITTQIGIPTVITQTVPFSGRVYELGPVTSGINELAYSFTPFDFLTSPFPETAPANPFWLTAPLTVISATLSSWEATVPEGLEGFFSIDLRAVDGLGNVEEAPASYRQWLGEIDTNTPRVAV